MEQNAGAQVGTGGAPAAPEAAGVGVSARRQPGKPYAWVALVMGLDLSYVGAALVLASSIKRRSSAAEMVVMVTPDVPQSARGVLGAVADAVVEVPYLETLALQKYSERFDKMYNYWLDKCFTKFAMFGLTEYKKVAFLDADMLAVEDPDALFDCPAPAGICSAVREIRENERMHGQKLPRTIVEESLKNGQGRYGVRGCLLIMEPCEATLARIRAKVEAREHYGSVESMVGPDELLITRYFINEWSHIHAKYGWVSWADREELGVAPVFLHYVSQKPWDEGEDWDDFEYWKVEARGVVKAVPSSMCYFGRLMDEIGSQAGVEVTDKMREDAREIKESANLRKAEAKAMRENRASRLNIDLTSNFAPRATPRSGRMAVGRQVPPLSPSSRLGSTQGGFNSVQKANGQNSGRWRNPSPVAVTRCSPVVDAAQTPAVAESDAATAPALQSKSGKVTKASPNILVVDGFKRPYPSKPRADKAPGAPATPKDLAVGPSAARPNTVPKLNLSIMKTDPKAPPPKKSSDDSDRGEGDPGTWQGMHWHKKRGVEPPSSVRSAADEMDSWRRGAPAQAQGSGPQSARPWTGGLESQLVTTPPATARPYLGVQEIADPASPPNSARPWASGQEARPPVTPPGSARVGQRSARYERWDAPKSSRADMASSWRSTPRGSTEEQGKERSEPPTRGWGGRSLGTGDAGAQPYSARVAATTQPQVQGGEPPGLQQGTRVLSINRQFGSTGNLEMPPGMLGFDWNTVNSTLVDAGRPAGLSLDAAGGSANHQSGASDNIIALLGKQCTDGWPSRTYPMDQQQHQRAGQANTGLLGSNVVAMGNGLGMGSTPLAASQPMYGLPSDSLGHALAHPDYSAAYGALRDSAALRLTSALASGGQRNGSTVGGGIGGHDSRQQWWSGASQRGVQGDGKLGGRGFDTMGQDTLLRVAQLNLGGGEGGQSGNRGVRQATWGQGPEVARSGSGSSYYWA
eukprot:evm.model.scf_361.8 EVM.evm.TU.scf_361.8   scf_361:54782-58631(-)